MSIVRVGNIALEKAIDGYQFLSCIGGGHSDIIAASAVSDYGGTDLIQWEGDWAKRELRFDSSRIGGFAGTEQQLKSNLAEKQVEADWFEYRKAATKYAFSTVLGSIRNLKTFVKMSVLASQNGWIGTYHNKYTNELLTTEGCNEYARMLKRAANSQDTDIAFQTLVGRRRGRAEIADVMCEVLNNRKNLQPAWADDKAVWAKSYSHSQAQSL